MREADLRAALLDAPVPGAPEAEERALQMVRSSYAAAPPPVRVPRRSPRPRRVAQVAVAVGLIAVAISPAGAAVRHWVRDSVGSEPTPAAPALTALPAPGSLLVDSARGPWVVREDGSKRLLGAYGESTWSPHGLYVAATGPHELVALDPLGEVRWTLSRGGSVRRPAWSPDGYRVAYIDGSQLRVVGGDGRGDHRLAAGIAPVAPAWEPRPADAHLLSYVDGDERVRTVSADGGRVAFDANAGSSPIGLGWSPDGSRLLVATRTALAAFDRTGRRVWREAAPPGTEIVSSAPATGGEKAATVLVSKSGAHGELAMLGPQGHDHTLFAGPGRFGEVLYSPDGEWLLLAWPGTDQWLFLNPAEPGHVVAIGDISAQFDPGTTSPPGFPSLAGWCCLP